MVNLEVISIILKLSQMSLLCLKCSACIKCPILSLVKSCLLENAKKEKGKAE